VADSARVLIVNLLTILSPREVVAPRAQSRLQSKIAGRLFRPAFLERHLPFSPPHFASRQHVWYPAQIGAAGVLPL